ncbi:sugar ABC transporter ATP-binding protein [Actinomyces sp. B33]|uniref:sugar ABC transporter ATP-binding protein n=1 Tax=Actinomyces sp. B33 TaxID=2942131 RepID=UPI0023415B27|nr:sugar ABC transporter ATP-binding protein [Actinomyces sp. B33]MDC4233610.1 sugar ABC transporter ATP-binding protein [Actinomyces sp. B33]
MSSEKHSPSEALRLIGITKTFPGVRALSGVDFAVEYGRCVALIGENGAGKSTLMKVLSGVHAATEGTMTLDGEPYAPRGPREAADKGVVLIHQELSLLPNLTLAENIFLGRMPRRGPILDRGTMNRQARDLLDRVGLTSIRPTALAGRCSIAVQQLVEIAKALAQRPRILVFDEPTASLGEDEVEFLFRIVDRLKEEGVGIVWITHRLAEVRRVAQSIVVLRDGEMVGGWDHGDATVDEMVATMVGRSIEDIYPRLPPSRDRVRLEIESLTRNGEFEDVTLDVRAGEILGIAGLVGAGRTELVETIFGARRPDSGVVRLDGQEMRVNSPRDAVRRGIVLVPEDRKGRGLAQRLTIADNISLPERAFWRGPVKRRVLVEHVRSAVSQVNLKGGLGQSASTLSGGNQQKGVIGKWLALEPQVFLFDEPTRGIDVGARSAIYDMIAGLASRGTAVIVVSSELPEVMGLSHRIAVLSAGKIAGVLTRDKFSEEALMRLAVSHHADGLVPAARAS